MGYSFNTRSFCLENKNIRTGFVNYKTIQTIPWFKRTVDVAKLGTVC